MNAKTQMSPAVGWAGVFVLYYALRSWLMWSDQQATTQRNHQHSDWCWLHCWPPVPLYLVVDLLVITMLTALSGGWMSPLYLLYLGWAVALMDVSSTLLCLWLAGLGGVAFVLGALLAPHQPFSAFQITLVIERLLVLLLLSLGIGAMRAYIGRARSLWEAEQRQWDELRQVVFSHLSHELSTPLSAVSVSAALLLSSENELAAERRQNLLRVIERNCARMNVLIDDLLALWRGHRQRFEWSPARLCCLTVAESVAQMLSPLLESQRQRLLVAAEPPDTSVFADARQLEQVLVNLLTNAQKYAPAGTSIALTIRGQHHEVVFAVHDDGPGVPLDEQKHLFELFYRGTNGAVASQGAGIGLALARALVVLQGGEIWVESGPERGSTFYFTLPAADWE